MGTTTVAIMLVKIANAEIICTETVFNSQIKYGDNVLTRIKYSQNNSEMLQIMKNEIME